MPNNIISIIVLSNRVGKSRIILGEGIPFIAPFSNTFSFPSFIYTIKIILQKIRYKKNYILYSRKKKHLHQEIHLLKRKKLKNIKYI